MAIHGGMSERTYFGQTSRTEKERLALQRKTLAKESDKNINYKTENQIEFDFVRDEYGRRKHEA